MRNKIAGLLLGLVAMVAAPAGAIRAQEMVTIDGVEIPRVVIAPPQTELARTIKAGLKQAYTTAATSRASAEAQKLYYFYGARHFEPLWLNETAAGEVTFSANAQKILDVFEKAYLTGLDPNDYLTPAIDLDAAADSSEALARLETAFSAAVLNYAQNTHSGRLNPRSVSSYISIRPEQLDKTKTLLELASTADPAAYLLALEPKHREFVALKTALAKYYDGTIEETAIIPEGGLIRPGKRDIRVPLLRERLGLQRPLTDPNVYDEAAVAAVQSFQKQLGLIVDGIVGPATVAALNGGSATTREDIIANMERWRWLPSDLGDFMVQVNIPEFRLAIMDHGKPVYTTRIVTGKRSNQTPIFSDEIEHIVVNPYWNVPRSIAANEIAPILANNPSYIARNNMELLYGGRVVDASAVDWSSTSISNFRIRQRPGAGNALGSIKFLFPNQHDVYLHDTPSKYLFDRSIRAFSHGCMRVQNPWDFAAALLGHEPKVTLASLESQRGGTEHWNNLQRHVPVHITYFTLRVDEDGTIRSYGDVYGHNQKVIDLLGL